jgi:hypothetical protein
MAIITTALELRSRRVSGRSTVIWTVEDQVLCPLQRNMHVATIVLCSIDRIVATTVLCLLPTGSYDCAVYASNNKARRDDRVITVPMGASAPDCTSHRAERTSSPAARADTFAGTPLHPLMY